ncbi:transaldolase [Zoogloea sp.]|uniref:transaldolase n=1 Tax=Zoogloea sp. TaxID=49181 RepID=UPI00261BE926|nr:transaldolase [Zoogloea sp.]MDD3354606.1 transaldolase [Zoogloea sp.]
MNPIQAARAAGQQIWLDNLSRALINDGLLARHIDNGVAGVTTNPAIFHKAIAEGQDYRPALAALPAGLSAEARYERLVIEDVQRACDVIRPVFDESQGDAGYVSLEVSPALADDEAGTVAAALRLKAAVGRDNLLVKIPATGAGIRAIETLTAAGVSLNVTLMFSLRHVDAVAGAYQRGLEQRAAAGADLRSVRSVASVFLSRWDSLVDGLLTETGSPAALALRGKTGVALARQAYRRYLARFHGEGFAPLAARGARPQSMLWASTGTKNPAYSDLMYVEPLIGAETVNTLPDATLTAFLDHGQVQAATLLADGESSAAELAALAALGIELDLLGERLQQEGLAQFATAFGKLLELTA